METMDEPVRTREPEEFSQDLVEMMWVRGLVGPWYLRPKQASVLDFIRAIHEPFFGASRRFGKTTTILIYDIEESIRRSLITRWCEPLKYQCREIVMPEMDQIQSRIPSRYRFTWHQTDSYYECKWNGSKIFLRGINEDRGESARGTKSDIVVADELGNWRDPIYILNEVLRPQLLTTRGKLIYTGTPPKVLTHAFYELRERASAEGRYIERLVHDIEILTSEEIEAFVQDMGGWDSPAVKRELLCQKVIDPNLAIIPEWKEEYVQEFEVDDCFQFYFKYDGLDIGVRDLTVCVFAHYDFKQAKLFFHDEFVISGPDMTTEHVAGGIKAKEAERFSIPGKPGEAYKVKKRVSDIDLLLIQDLNKLHQLYFEPTDKGSLEEMVNEVRIWVNAGRIIVHPRCHQIIDCMRYGIWDENRKAWERSERLGHFDALAAVMYLVRNVDTRTNPVPAEHGRPEDDYFWEKNPAQERREKLKKLFNVPRRRVLD